MNVRKETFYRNANSRLGYVIVRFDPQGKDIDSYWAKDPPGAINRNHYPSPFFNFKKKVGGIEWSQRKKRVITGMKKYLIIKKKGKT